MSSPLFKRQNILEIQRWRSYAQEAFGKENIVQEENLKWQNNYFDINFIVDEKKLS